MPQKINTTSTYLHSHKLPRPVSVCLAGSTQLLKPPFSEARLCAGRESNVPPNLTSLPAQEESCGSRKSSAQTLWRIVKNISLYLAFVSSRRRRRRFWRRLFFSSSTYFFSSPEAVSHTRIHAQDMGVYLGGGLEARNPRPAVLFPLFGWRRSFFFEEEETLFRAPKGVGT